MGIIVLNQKVRTALDRKLTEDHYTILSNILEFYLALTVIICRSSLVGSPVIVDENGENLFKYWKNYPKYIQ